MNIASHVSPEQVSSLVNKVFDSETIVCFDGDVITKLAMGEAQCTITLQLNDSTDGNPARLGLHIRLTVDEADGAIADFSLCSEEELQKCLYLLQADLLFSQLECYMSEEVLLVELSRMTTIPFQSATLENQLEVIEADLLAVVSEWQSICTSLQLILRGDISTKDEVDTYLKASHPNVIN